MGAVVISGELIQMSPIVLRPTKGGTKPSIFDLLFPLQIILRSLSIATTSKIINFVLGVVI